MGVIKINSGGSWKEAVYKTTTTTTCSCSGRCSGGCTGCYGCGSNCYGGCYGGCSSCTGGCYTGCSGYCYKSCSGECTSCTDNCNYTCSGTCVGCSASCYWTCKKNCTNTSTIQQPTIDSYFRYTSWYPDYSTSKSAYYSYPSIRYGSVGGYSKGNSHSTSSSQGPDTTNYPSGTGSVKNEKININGSWKTAYYHKLNVGGTWKTLS